MKLKLSKKQKEGAAVGAVIGVILLLVLFVVAGGPAAMQQKSFGNSASTQYGEKLDINLSVGGQTLQGAWSAPARAPQLGPQITATIIVLINANASQNLYTVNSSYYSQQKVQYSVTVSITGAQVQSVQLANLTLQCRDVATGKLYNWLAVLSQAITLPYSNTWTGLQYISDHLTAIGASTSDATIQYKIYAKVTATGSVSGTTLTAQTGGGAFSQFTAYHFVYSTESTGTTVTPSVGPASWTDAVSIGLLAAIAVELIFAVIYIRQIRRQKSS